MRYQTAYLGSNAFAGTLKAADLARIREKQIVKARRTEKFLGYAEVHIEQGPVLESKNLPVGVVTAIAGQSRIRVEFHGTAGHAGTVPMNLRRDALAGAAELVLAAESCGITATVGKLEVAPGASNVIPGHAVLTVDIRHQSDARRLAAVKSLHTKAHAIAKRRGLKLLWQPVQENGAVPCDKTLTQIFSKCVANRGLKALPLPSGAGHDGVVLSQICPIAMLFVRCKDGISHNPAESVKTADVKVAIEILANFLTQVAAVCNRRHFSRMSDFDTIIRGGTLITHDSETIIDIGIAEEKIVALKKDLPGSGKLEIDARNLHIFPGIIDAHVHFNEPGRADWEGLETGSHALAAGGGTTFFDMPLNAHPPTCDVASFDLKAAAAQNKSVTDFALWGGLVPHNLEQIERLAERGVVGFKAFMSDSGIDDFPRADHTTLRKGMKRAASVNRLVAVHAESESLTQRLAQEKMTRGMTSARDYLNSRPIEAELEAIRNAIDTAGDVGCKLHIVHVSSAEGVSLITDAKKRGADVSCETCPHYLILTENDTLKLGAVAKCAPPLRPPRERDALWEQVIAGAVTTIGSDHSPSPPEMKQNPNFFKVWGGISGVQHLLPLLIGSPEALDHFGSRSIRRSAHTPREVPFARRQADVLQRRRTFRLAQNQRPHRPRRGRRFRTRGFSPKIFRARRGFILSPQTKPLRGPHVDRAGRSDHSSRTNNFQAWANCDPTPRPID